MSGTIVADGSGSPLSGICATAFPTAGGNGTSGPATASNGTYGIAGLAAGSYRVKFSQCVGSVIYASEYYNNTLDFGAAAIVSVTTGVTTSGINASLAIGGSISGTVVADQTGAPLANICVSAQLVSTSSSISRPTTAADGTYVIAGLAAGSYKLRFSDCVGNVDYASEYYNNKPDFTSADAVTVTAGAITPGINAGMAAGGSISGTVVADGSGTPLAGMCAVASPTIGGTGTSSSPSASDGTYVVAGIAVGTYRVRFNDCVGSIDYATEYYDNTQSSTTATIVTVTAGATTSGINAGLAVAGRISGTVVADATGAPLANICVSAIPASGGSTFTRPTTAADGTYTIAGLAPGNYKVKFEDCVGNVDYAFEYYNNTLNFSAADLLSVTAGATTPGINAGMAAGGSISGTVVADGSGAPLAGICATVLPTSGSIGASNSPSVSDGTYVFAGLAVGTYRVRFNDCVGSIDYATEYYDNTQSSTTATIVTVTAGATTTGINAGLAVAGRISGTVVSEATGAPLAGICVSASLASGGTIFSRPTTAADGTYTNTGLLPGTYRVKYEDCVGNVDYATEYYNNKDFNAADVVTVTAGATTSGINAGLAAGGSISGTIVADGSGVPLPGMCAVASPSAGGSGVSSPPTGSDGMYVITGLALGTHRVFFNDCVGSIDYATEFYDNTQSAPSATLVSVTAGATTPGITASLAIAGRISGTVVADATGAPLAGICISASLASGGSSFSQPITAADGTYTYAGLAPGGYKVTFRDCVGTVDYVTEHYNNKPDFNAADVVVVTAGATTSGINAGMAAGTSQAPAITSANSTAFTVGAAGSFTVTATGSPAPALSQSGGLPTGVTFNAGTGVLSGTPAAGTAGTYNLTFTAANGVGSNATQNFTLTVAPAATGQDFNPLTPARILDTRGTVGGHAGKLAAGETANVVVTGVGGVPASAVDSVVLNVTATGGSASTFLSVFPAGQIRPFASNLNVVAGQDVPNLVVAKVGTGGSVSLYNNQGSIDVIFDVVGWYKPAATCFTSLTPARILDTRSTSKVGPGQARDIQVTGVGGVPSSGVGAVVVNVTATAATASTFLTVFPAGQTRPDASNLNVVPGQDVPNLVVAKVGANGNVTVYNNQGSVDVIFDVVGWHPSGATCFTSLTPARIVDSRSTTKVGPTEARDVKVTGVGGVPGSGVAAVVLNVTATEATASTFLTVFPAGQTRPDASNLNVVPGQDVPNLVVAKVGANGNVTIYNNQGSTHVIFDVVGYFPG